MFDAGNTGSTGTAHPPPGDHPLLREHESGFLDSFFNDPNNIDPTSLSSMPTDFHGDTANAFANTNFDWLNQSGAGFEGAPGTSTPNVGQAGLGEWQNSSLNMQSASDNSRQMAPSADVYQAAGILHNNTNTASRQQGSNAYSGVPYASGVNVQESNGFAYPPISNSNAPSYYNSPTTTNNPYNGYQQARFPEADSNNQFASGFNNNGATTGRRNVSLNFGSDDRFADRIHEASNVSSNITGPDKDLVDAITHGFTGQGKPSFAETHSAPMANMRKRGRNLEDEDDNVKEEDASYDEDDPAPRKRRKGKSKDDEEEDYEEGSFGRGKKAKRRPLPMRTSSATSREPLASPDQRLPRSAGPRPPRENLSEEQKRSNHIQSEQKRRNLIKQGFEDLTRMVPELRSGSLSKSNMLTEAARFIRKMRDENNALEALVGPLDKG